ncbi:TBC1 domain family member 25-like [Myotis daubentonii]|uniref:TBC1 domain family member 25-like n=1 Tax=Myotis daubentonii TaxID=98922 RepID=UPI0028738E05|nr:TBC1 domain family member 25-like [Myotis daubentonii]
MASACGSSALAGSGASPPGPGVQAAGAKEEEEEEEQEVVRVRVQKCAGFLPPELRSFAVDPQITPLDVLQHILARAFDLSGKHFDLRYRGRDGLGQEVYLPLRSDRDLSRAFAAASKPFLQLRLDLGPAEARPLLEDGDLIGPQAAAGPEVPLPEQRAPPAAPALPFTQGLLAQVGRTWSRVQQVLSWSPGKEVKPFCPPLSEAEFHAYLHPDGRLSRPAQLRLRIYQGGVAPSLRGVVWQHLLNVLPARLTARQRAAYVSSKSREYERLKSEWAQRASPEDLERIRGAVLRDVRRTDRAHPYYAGPEDGPHLRALHDLLTTYAVTHPQVSYRQGMSDLASPLLAALDHEGQAFLCFCAIMRRLAPNFHPDGWAMAVKFAHLQLLLRHVDPDFYRYLRAAGAHNLLFCYRWLLLELKREFAFEDALRMLEVTWSSLPPDPPEREVELVGSPSHGADTGSRSCGEQPLRQGHRPRPAGGRGGAFEEAVDPLALTSQEPGGGGQLPRPASLDDLQQLRDNSRPRRDPLAQLFHPTVLISSKSLSKPLLNSSESLLFSSSLPGSPSTSSPPSSQEASPAAGSLLMPEVGSPQDPGKSLPPPQELGQGNPFMLFLCLAILLEHRGQIMRNRLDYHEVAMHFDRLVGKHPLGRVLHRAKALFADYLQSYL